MLSAGGVAEILSDAAAAARDRAAGQGLQLGLELDEAGRAALDVLDLDQVDDEDRLGLPHSAEIQEIQRELDCDVYHAVREQRRRSGAGGRKLGSVNRRNKEFRDFVLAQGGHPGLFLQRVFDRPTEQLAAELGCTSDQALDKQIRCAAELLPYLEGKMPAVVHHHMKGDMALLVAPGTGLFDGIEDGEYDELPTLGFSEGNQDDSARDGEASD